MSQPALSQRATEEFFLEPDPRALEWWPNGQAKTMLLTTLCGRLIGQQVRVSDEGVPQRTSLTHYKIAGVPETRPGPNYVGRRSDSRGSGGAGWRNAPYAERSRSRGTEPAAEPTPQPASGAAADPPLP